MYRKLCQFWVMVMIKSKWARKKRSNFNSTIITRANVVSKSFISELIMIFIASSIECIWWVWLLNLSSFHFHRCHIIAKCSIFSHTVARLLPCTWNKRIKCINLLIYYRLWLICRIFMKINPFRLYNQFIKFSEKFNFNKRQFVSVAAACNWTYTVKYCGRFLLIYFVFFPLSRCVKISQR